jgi:hypothetical protein
MQRKKGIYDLVYYKKKNEPQPVINGADWKKIQQLLITDYKEFINVKDEAHTSEPFFVVVTNAKNEVKEKDLEEYFYTKRK